MAEPRFLTRSEVLYLHDGSLARFGGIAGIGNPGLVESALGSAQNVHWYGHGDLFDVAAAAIMFFKVNGVNVPKDAGSIYTALIDVAKMTLNKAGLAAVLRRLVKMNI